MYIDHHRLHDAAAIMTPGRSWREQTEEEEEEDDWYLLTNANALLLFLLVKHDRTPDNNMLETPARNLLAFAASFSFSHFCFRSVIITIFFFEPGVIVMCGSSFCKH
jgi:hypothetical protein